MKRRSSFGWSELLVGLLLIVTGVLSFVTPLIALGTFVIVCGILAVISGAGDILFYVRVRKRVERGSALAPVSSLIGGIITIAIGIILMFNVRAGAIVFGILFPLWIIVHSAARLFNLHFVRLIGGNFAFGLTVALNVIGILLGAWLLFNPLSSAVYLTYVLGAYLLILGIGNIVIAFGKLGDPY